jgi:uncharacterized protein YndB with AHSA1/START domain
MKMMLRQSSIMLLLITAGASAEVVDSGSGGFTSINEVTIDADRASVWKAAIADVGDWWSSDHTISGDASALSITPRPQGCFCESLGAGAGVVHLTVTMVSPGVVIRLTGGLGPLGLMGVNGNMTWEFDDDDENGTRVKFTYVVGGYSPEGLDTIAGPVDFVVGEALQLLKAHIESGDPAISDID